MTYVIFLHICLQGKFLLRHLGRPLNELEVYRGTPILYHSQVKMSADKVHLRHCIFYDLKAKLIVRNLTIKLNTTQKLCEDFKYNPIPERII